MTPTEKRIYDLLSDGLPHSRPEIHGLLGDELQPLSRIQLHISTLRKHINPKGIDVKCVYYKRNLYYQMFRLLASSNE